MTAIPNEDTEQTLGNSFRTAMEDLLDYWEIFRYFWNDKGQEPEDRGQGVEPWARKILRFATFGIPIILIVQTWIAYSTNTVPLKSSLILLPLLFWALLLVFLVRKPAILTVAAINPTTVKRFDPLSEKIGKMLRAIAVGCFILIAYGLYLAFVPMAGNGMAFVLPWLVLAFMFATAFQGNARKNAFRVLFAVLAGITIFFVANNLYAKNATTDKALTAEGFYVKVHLLGENVPSEEKIDVDHEVPGGWQCKEEGSALVMKSANVHFSDGTFGPITKDFGVKGGVLYWTGPKGETLIYRCKPAGEAWTGTEKEVVPSRPPETKPAESEPSAPPKPSADAAMSGKTEERHAKSDFGSGCCKVQEPFIGIVEEVNAIEGYIILSTPDGPKTIRPGNAALYAGGHHRLWWWLCEGAEVEVNYDSRGIKYMRLLKWPEGARANTLF